MDIISECVNALYDESACLSTFTLFISIHIHGMSLYVQRKVLLALENAGVFTSGGLVKDKVAAK